MTPIEKQKTSKFDFSLGAYIVIMIFCAIASSIPLMIQSSQNRTLNPILGKSATNWSIFAIIVSVSFFFFGLFVKIVARVLRLNFKRKAVEVFFRFQKLAVWLVCWSITVLVSYDVLLFQRTECARNFDGSVITPDACTLVSIRRFIVLFLAFSVGLLLEKTGIAIVSRTYYRMAFKKRVVENTERLAAINLLLNKASEQSSSENSPNENDIESGHKDRFLNFFTTRLQPFYDLKALRRHITFIRSKGQTIDVNDYMNEARQAGHNIFDFYADKDTEVITEACLLPYFSQDQAASIFLVIDEYEEGEIDSVRLKETVQDIFQKNLNLSRGQVDMKRAVSKLDSFMFIVMLILLGFVALKIYDVDLKSNLALAFSLMLAINVFVGSTIKNVIDSTIFIFSTYPFDVGDSVILGTPESNTIQKQKPTILTVQKINLLTTLFLNESGDIISSPNNVMAGASLVNISRSEDNIQNCRFDLGSEVTIEVVEEFRTAFKQFLTANEKYLQKDFQIDPLPNENMEILFEVKVYHKDPKKRKNWEIRLKVSSFLKQYSTAIKAKQTQ